MSPGDGTIWQNPVANQQQIQQTQEQIASEWELNGGEAMTCQELLALSGALSAALPTGQIALDSFFHSLTKGIANRNHTAAEDAFAGWPEDDFTCCQVCVNYSIDSSLPLKLWIQNISAKNEIISKNIRCTLFSILIGILSRNYLVVF